MPSVCAALCFYYAAVCLYYVLCCCMLAYNYVDMMYACSLFVTHTDIFSPLALFGECDNHKGTAGHLLTRRLFLANIYSPLHA